VILGDFGLCWALFSQQSGHAGGHKNAFSATDQTQKKVAKRLFSKKLLFSLRFNILDLSEKAISSFSVAVMGLKSG
jgi:hypothetical protein